MKPLQMQISKVGLCNFEVIRTIIFKKNSYYGQNCQYPKWNFTQALLFSLTAITTIGKAIKFYKGQI